MPVRSTSKAAVIELRETGKSSKKREQIFNYVADHPGCSRREIAERIPGMTINCVSGRVAELIECGALIEDGCKHDEITGRSVNLLFVADNRKAA